MDEKKEKSVPGEEKPGYRTATIVLSVALVAVIALFFITKYTGQKDYTTPSFDYSVNTSYEHNNNAGGSSGKININTATQEELTALDSIGDTRAKKIIEYRTITGGFNSTEEIMSVDGIGDKIYRQIADSITVD